MSDFLEGSTIRTVAMGCGLLGFTAGTLGTFAVVRRESLIGDAVSHAALPGIVIGFLLLGKAPLGLAVGAAIAGWLALRLVSEIAKNRRIPYDAALGGMLAFFFGMGLMLKTVLQRRSTDPDKMSIDRYLFGQASFLSPEDLRFLMISSVIILTMLFLFWKQFKLISFDRDQAILQGFAVKRYESILLLLQVFAIVLGLQAVGVVLMSAMFVAPTLAARGWTYRIGKLSILAGCFGALAGIAGAILSDTLSDPKLSRTVPTGPTIVLIATGLVFVSNLFGARLRTRVA
jgi:manganese/zinc/iron transport system permease protein